MPFAPLVRDVQEFVRMFAVPRPAAEASQGKGPDARKLVSLSMDERYDWAIPYMRCPESGTPVPVAGGSGRDATRGA
jgi:hypothetical protein